MGVASILSHKRYVINLIFAFADVVKMVTLQGKPRVSKKQLSELQFNFQIESISKHEILYSFAICVKVFTNKISWRSFSVCLQDSVLAFHKHGMQGRSFKNGEVTQEISDPSRTYRLLGSDKYVSHKLIQERIEKITNIINDSNRNFQE